MPDGGAAGHRRGRRPPALAPQPAVEPIALDGTDEAALAALRAPPPIRQRIAMSVRRAESVLGLQFTDLNAGLDAAAAGFRAGGRVD